MANPRALKSLIVHKWNVYIVLYGFIKLKLSQNNQSINSLNMFSHLIDEAKVDLFSLQTLIAGQSAFIILLYRKLGNVR